MIQDNALIYLKGIRIEPLKGIYLTEKVKYMHMFKSRKGLMNVIGATLLLHIIAFYNSYPLVYSDTGTYIYSGFDLFVPKDRPVLYGLFIRFFSFKQSLWLGVFVQNFLTAFVVYRVMQLFLKKQLTTYYFLVIGILLFGSSIGWYSNQIMPDFFTPILILTWIWILFDEYLKWQTLTMAFLLIVVANCSHFSHLLISSLLLVVLLLTKTIIGKKSFLVNFQFSKKRLFFFIGVVLFSWVALPTLNASVDGKFQLSKGSHVFLMAHLNEKGLLKMILDDYCNTPEFADCSLCEDKENLPQDIDQFIWTGDFLERHGGWENSKNSFDQIIQLSLTKPKYLAYNFVYSALYGAIQLAHVNTGEGLTPYIEHSAPFGQIAWRFPHELHAYLNAKQNKFDGVALDFSILNIFHITLIILSFLFLLYVLINQVKLTLTMRYKALIYFILLGILCNSLVTAGLSAPYTRYQSRVIWLLPFIAIIILFNYWNKQKKELQQQDQS
jgi:hypothetical protein